VYKDHTVNKNKGSAGRLNREVKFCVYTGGAKGLNHGQRDGIRLKYGGTVKLL
jgi:hypothetical protein